MTATWQASLVAVTPAQTTAPTFSEICGLPWTALDVLHELSGAGSATVATPVDRVDPVAADRLLRLDETCTELWIRRTTSATSSELVHAGPIIGCQIKNRTLTLVSPGLLAYLASWLRDTDYTGSGKDVADVVKDLIDQYQALDYGSMGLDTSELTTLGVALSPFTISALEPVFLDAAIVDLGQRSSGFDIAIDPATRVVRMWAPRRGTDRSADVVMDARSIATPDVSWSAAPTQVFSDLVATSSSPTGATLRSSDYRTSLRQSLGRRYGRRSYTNIADQAQLDDTVDRALDNATTQSIVVTPDLLPVVGFGFGDFEVGDIIGYDYDAGLGSQTGTPRVASIQVTATSGAEVLKVGLV